MSGLTTAGQDANPIDHQNCQQIKLAQGSSPAVSLTRLKDAYGQLSGAANGPTRRKEYETQEKSRWIFSG